MVLLSPSKRIPSNTLKNFTTIFLASPFHFIVDHIIIFYPHFVKKKSEDYTRLLNNLQTNQPSKYELYLYVSSAEISSLLCKPGR
jgi:hypothetical protein